MGTRPVRTIVLPFVFTIVFIGMSAMGARSDTGFLPSLPTDTVTSPEIQEALSDSRQSLDLQTHWPTEVILSPEPFWPVAWLEEILEKFWGALAKAAEYILWGAIILILAVILFHLQENLWSNSRSQRLRAEEEKRHDAETSQRMDSARVEAEELARNGGFAEAMHVLLLESVNELRRRLDVSIAASLTSREILQHIGIPQEGHLAFADIINRVEISHFGLHEPGEEEYLACRENFAVLTRSLFRKDAP